MTYANPASAPARSIGGCSRIGAGTSADAGEVPPAGPPDEADGLAELQHAFRRTGGIVTGEWLAAAVRSTVEQPISLLARMIVNRQVISFEAQGLRWLPMFQFEANGLAVIEGVRQVLAELRDVYDDGELALWFAAPNCWIAGVSPANAIGTDVLAVVRAARADRFVAMG